MFSEKAQKHFSNILLTSFIIIFCFFIAIANTGYSNTLDNALLISDKIKIPDNNSPQLIWMKDSISLISFVQSLFLRLDVSILRISQATLILSTIFFFTGIYLIVINLLKSIFNKKLKIVSFLFTSLTIIFDSHLPHTDYPNAYFAGFTSGIFSIALSTLIFGLIADGKNKKVIFFTIMLIFVHPVQGMWISGILTLTYIINIFLSKKKITYKEIKKLIFIFITLTTVTLYYLFFYLGFNNIVNNDIDLLDAWLSNWEPHRNNTTFSLNYLKITSLLFLICMLFIIFFRKKIKENLFIFFLSLGLTVTISSVVYILYKIFYTSLPLFVIIPMPTRLINTHSMIAYPVILISGFIVTKFISDYLKINKNLFLIVALTIFSLIIVFDHQYKNLNDRFNFIFKNRFETTYYNFIGNLTNKDIDRYSTKFWMDFRKVVNTEHYTLVTKVTEKKSYTYGLKPFIIKPTSFDYVLYSPSTVAQTSKILEKIYEINFFNSNLKKFTEEHIRITFENKKDAEWKKIYKEFNVKYVFVPQEWEIDLKMKLKNEKFSLYEIQ